MDPVFKEGAAGMLLLFFCKLFPKKEFYSVKIKFFHLLDFYLTNTGNIAFSRIGLFFSFIFFFRVADISLSN